MLGTDPGGRPDSRECLEIFLKILPGLESFPESPVDSDDIVTSAVCSDTAVNVTENYLADPDRCPVFNPDTSNSALQSKEVTACMKKGIGRPADPECEGNAVRSEEEEKNTEGMHTCSDVPHEIGVQPTSLPDGIGSIHHAAEKKDVLPGLESFPESPMDSDDIVTSAVCSDMVVDVTENNLADPDRCPVFNPDTTNSALQSKEVTACVKKGIGRPADPECEGNAVRSEEEEKNTEGMHTCSDVPHEIGVQPTSLPDGIGSIHHAAEKKDVLPGLESFPESPMDSDDIVTSAVCSDMVADVTENYLADPDHCPVLNPDTSNSALQSKEVTACMKKGIGRPADPECEGNAVRSEEEEKNTEGMHTCSDVPHEIGVQPTSLPDGIGSIHHAAEKKDVLPGLESFPESPMDSDDIVTSAVCSDMVVDVTENNLADPDRCPVFNPDTSNSALQSKEVTACMKKGIGRPADPECDSEKDENGMKVLSSHPSKEGNDSVAKPICPFLPENSVKKSGHHKSLPPQSHTGSPKSDSVTEKSKELRPADPECPNMQSYEVNDTDRLAVMVVHPYDDESDVPSGEPHLLTPMIEDNDGSRADSVAVLSSNNVYMYDNHSIDDHVCSEDDDNSVNDPDYQPSHSESGDTMSDFSESLQDEPSKAMKMRKHATSRSSKHHKQSGPGSHCTIGVKQAKAKTETGKRIWDRKHYCVYCHKEMGNLYRHFIRIHSKETDVAYALSLSNYSERIKQLKKLKYKGNFHHNYMVTKTGRGKVVPFKRPSHSSLKSGTDYLPCKACLGFYSKKAIGKHWRTCQFAKEQKEQTSKVDQRSHRYQKAASYLLPVADSTSRQVKEKVLPSMRQDDVTLAARNDRLIMTFAARSYEQNAHKKKINSFVSERIRTLGRLLIQMRQIDSSIKELDDCIYPAKFNSVIHAVRSLAGFDEEASTYTTPSLGLKSGYYLKDCAQIVLSQAIQCDSKSDEERANRFMELYRLEWERKVSAHAGHTLQARRCNKPNLLPLTEDILKLTNRIDDIMRNTSKNLKEKTLIQGSWASMCKATLAQVILFNRRREGEVSQMLLTTYMESSEKSVDQDEEVMKCLSPLEKQLLNQFTRIEIPGKRGRNVPILLTPQLKNYIDLLCRMRSEAGVHPNNRYLFARQYDSLGCHSGSQCLRLYAASCGAKSPGRLTSTNLRKHVATVSQFLNLNNNELDILADFLGHNINIHREYYRLPQATLQVCKISKLLLSLEQGDPNTCIFKGKSLDEIGTDVLVNDTSPDEEILGEPGENLPVINLPGVIEEANPAQELSELIIDQENMADNLAKSAATVPAASTRKPKQHKKWTTEEESAIHRALKKNYAERKVPLKDECIQAIQKEPALRNRSWRIIKDHVRNWIVRN
ncbi:uncharacterized protein [Ptychodera flava]|uniref:uncharacterized protein n=1 Tax=Ptychodera flava TaxID=63121 RepID=UPI003969C23B